MFISENSKNHHLPVNKNELKISKRYQKKELLFKILVIGDFGVGESVSIHANQLQLIINFYLRQDVDRATIRRW